MAATFLTNQFLIAMPGMSDPNFAQTVTLVCEHNAQGALGIVIIPCGPGAAPSIP